jgi:hypothetical protein
MGSSLAVIQSRQAYISKYEDTYISVAPDTYCSVFVCVVGVQPYIYIGLLFFLFLSPIRMTFKKDFGVVELKENIDISKLKYIVQNWDKHKHEFPINKENDFACTHTHTHTDTHTHIHAYIQIYKHIPCTFCMGLLSHAKAHLFRQICLFLCIQFLNCSLLVVLHCFDAFQHTVSPGGARKVGNVLKHIRDRYTNINDVHGAVETCSTDARLLH